MALRATFLTLFPESLGPILQSSILGRGQKAVAEVEDGGRSRCRCVRHD